MKTVLVTLHELLRVSRGEAITAPAPAVEGEVVEIRLYTLEEFRAEEAHIRLQAMNDDYPTPEPASDEEILRLIQPVKGE